MPVYMYLVFFFVVGGISFGISHYTLSRLGDLFERIDTLSGFGLGMTGELSIQYYIISAAMIVLYFIVSKGFPLLLMRVFGWLSGLWMAYLILVLFYAGPLHVLEYCFIHILGFDNQHFMISGITVLSLILVHFGFIWGVYRATRAPHLFTVEIANPKISPEFNGYRILQLSDVHIGPTIGEGLIHQLRSIIASARPDLIVMTGDLVDGEVKQLGAEVKSFLALSELAPQGMLLITGNHEYISGAAQWVSFIKDNGGRVLENEHVTIERGNAKISVIGVEDWDAERFDSSRRPALNEAIDGVPKEAFKVLLAHQPKAANEAATLGIDLQLSGHTHAGQIFPFNVLIYLDQPFNVGRYELGSMTLYVNPGTAYWGPPLRIGTRSEVTLFKLTGSDTLQS